MNDTTPENESSEVRDEGSEVRARKVAEALALFDKACLAAATLQKTCLQGVQRPSRTLADRAQAQAEDVVRMAEEARAILREAVADGS